MVFAKKDPNINRSGRIDKVAPLTNRALREKELAMLLRRIRPHMAESIMTAANIMKNEKASETSRLRAAVVLLDAYRKLVIDLYGGADPTDDPNEDPNETGAVLSLRVIDKP